MGRADPDAAVVLSHHGIKGMKWGQRKAGTGAPSKRAKRVDPHNDHTKVKDLRKDKTKTLSNEEIQTINKRLQLERSYSELASQTSTISKGQKKVAAVLALGATAQAAYTLAKSPVGQAAKKAIVTGLKTAKAAGAAAG